MSAEGLRSALAGAGLSAEVEGHERLAVLRAPGAVASRALSAQRGRVAALAAEHGFTHVALEIVEGGPAARGDAALPGD